MILYFYFLNMYYTLFNTVIQSDMDCKTLYKKNTFYVRLLKDFVNDKQTKKTFKIIKKEKNTFKGYDLLKQYIVDNEYDSFNYNFSTLESLNIKNVKQIKALKIKALNDLSNISFVKIEKTENKGFFNLYLESSFLYSFKNTFYKDMLKVFDKNQKTFIIFIGKKIELTDKNYICFEYLSRYDLRLIGNYLINNYRFKGLRKKEKDLLNGFNRLRVHNSKTITLFDYHKVSKTYYDKSDNCRAFVESRYNIGTNKFKDKIEYYNLYRYKPYFTKRELNIPIEIFDLLVSKIETNKNFFVKTYENKICIFSLKSGKPIYLLDCYFTKNSNRFYGLRLSKFEYGKIKNRNNQLQFFIKLFDLYFLNTLLDFHQIDIL